MRDLINIFEGKTLALQKGQMPRFRGLYAAFIVVMRPDDFLRLTTGNRDELQSIKDRPFPMTQDTYNSHDYYAQHPENYNRFEMPFLIVSFPSGKIKGHEGRHRAAMVLRDGGKSFPVMICPREDDIHTAVVKFVDKENSWTPGHWNEKDEWVDGSHNITGEDRTDYNNHEDANAHIVDYIIGKRRPPEGMKEGPSGVEVQRGGGELKGAPARSSGWDKAAWTVEDFPEKLVGQYSRYETLSKSRMKIGLVKGYRHHFDRKR